MKRLALLGTLLILVIMVLPAGSAQAAPHLDRVIKEGETVEEDLVIFGGSLVIEEGATVEGDVSVFGGTATIAGLVDGDVSIFGGSTELSGMVNGDLVIFGGNLSANTSAGVDGECVLIGGNVNGDGAGSLNCTTVGDLPGFEVPAFVMPPVRIAPPEPAGPGVTWRSSSGFFGTISSVAGRSLVLGILALLIAAVAPVQLNRVSDTLARKPAASGAVGVLTAIAAPSLAVILLIISAILTIVCIGLLGYPIVFILLAALAVGVIVGWIAAGTLIGRWLARVLGLRNRSLMVTAALGTVVLTLAGGLLSSLPFFLGGWLWFLVALGIGFAGLGAVALTRFGTRPYPLITVQSGKVETMMETLPVEEVGGEGSSEKQPADLE